MWLPTCVIPIFIILLINKEMREKVLAIINEIRATKELPAVSSLNVNDNLRNNLDLTSFDLAELTVRIEDEFDIDIFEDGLVNTIGEVLAKLENKNGMTMFLYNGEQSYSYADLLKAVCMDDYVPLLKTHDLFKYFPT